MPEIISCPECNRKLRVAEDLIGKKVKCPGCSLMFTAGGNGAARADDEPVEVVPDKSPARRRDDDDYDDRRPRRRDDEYDDDRRSRRRRDDEDDYDDDRRGRRSRRDDEYDKPRSRPRDERKAWDRVALGIKLTIVGGWVGVATSLVLGVRLILVGAFGVGLASYDLDSDVTKYIPPLMATLTMLCQLGEVVLVGIGAGFAMVVPASRNAPVKPLGITAFVLAVTWAVLLIVGDIVAFATWGSYAIVLPVGIGGSGIVLRLADLVWVGYLMVFLIFLRFVCRVVREWEQGEIFLKILIGFAILAGVATICYILIWTGAVASMFSASSARTTKSSITTGGIVFTIVGCLLVLASVCLRVWYILTAMKVQETVGRYARRIGSS